MTKELDEVRRLKGLYDRSAEAETAERLAAAIGCLQKDRRTESHMYEMFARDWKGYPPAVQEAAMGYFSTPEMIGTLISEKAYTKLAALHYLSDADSTKQAFEEAILGLIPALVEEKDLYGLEYLSGSAWHLDAQIERVSDAAVQALLGIGESGSDKLFRLLCNGHGTLLSTIKPEQLETLIGRLVESGELSKLCSLLVVCGDVHSLASEEKREMTRKSIEYWIERSLASWMEEYGPDELLSRFYRSDSIICRILDASPWRSVLEFAYDGMSEPVAAKVEEAMGHALREMFGDYVMKTVGGATLQGVIMEKEEIKRLMNGPEAIGALESELHSILDETRAGATMRAIAASAFKRYVLEKFEVISLDAGYASGTGQKMEATANPLAGDGMVSSVPKSLTRTAPRVGGAQGKPRLKRDDR